jgi:hypothetical protein
VLASWGGEGKTVESSIKTWFTALSDQDKQLFLATSGANLTAFARQATRLGELRGMNEIHHHIYQAFEAISAGQLTFSANELWEALNSVAKEYRLDMVLHQVFETSKMLLTTAGSMLQPCTSSSPVVASIRSQRAPQTSSTLPTPPHAQSCS